MDRRWGSKLQRQYLASAGVLFSATVWGLIFYPMRWLEGQGVNAIWASLLMYLLALLLGGWLSFPYLQRLRHHPWRLGLLALSNGWSNLAYVVALIDGNVVRVLLLFYLYPMWSILIGWWFLHERPGRADLYALGLALLGALVILWSPRVGSTAMQASDLLALSAGLSFAIANATIRSLAHLPLALMTNVTWVGVVMVSALWLLWSHDPLPEFTPGSIGVLLAMGWLGIISMTLAVQYGIRELPLYRSATLLLFEVLVGAVGAQFLAHEQMSTVEWLGGGAILLAAYAAFQRQRTDV